MALGTAVLGSATLGVGLLVGESYSMLQVQNYLAKRMKHIDRQKDGKRVQQNNFLS